jgi:hypothetical protein
MQAADDATGRGNSLNGSQRPAPKLAPAASKNGITEQEKK